MNSEKYMIVNHTYEGFAGEACDWVRKFVDIDEAISCFEYRKKYVNNYLDSFMMLIDVESSKIIKSYFAFDNDNN